MKNICLWSLLLCGNTAAGQVLLKTVPLPEVYVIGVEHTENKYRNADSLLKLLKHIRPDLILSETDTLSGYFKSDYSLVAPPAWYTAVRKRGAGRSMPPEMEVLYKYTGYTDSVFVCPFDIAMPNRRKYVQDLHERESQWIADINAAEVNKEIPKTLLTYHTAYIQYSNWLYRLTQLGYPAMNRRAVTDSIRQMIAFEAVYFPEVTALVPRLRPYKDWHTANAVYWQLRNETMAANIIRIIALRKARTIVVFTGLLHKYYLIDLLSNKKGLSAVDIAACYEDDHSN